jgi:hypothetical protein
MLYIWTYSQNFKYQFTISNVDLTNFYWPTSQDRKASVESEWTKFASMIRFQSFEFLSINGHMRTEWASVMREAKDKLKGL